ncbi:malonate transporter, MadL subunit [Pseudomonas amygdali pv. mori str. 301020]|uniref:Malonate transporter, MadL subunit n=1 Tax=Pseudomonas amygdali pv. mori str. 301020 TaxID=629261 RepID=A0A656G3H1_PSEA0|nr:malonate transporter, MadL subunit [Pseudomonas amygdali pv. mori str. 301020]
MIIYGVALLAICTLAGVILGDMLGVLLGVKSNVGGVGIAMILLICARLWMQKHGGMTKDCEMGVVFWGALYIPVVVAMAAQQNLVTALKGGPVAVLAALFRFCGALRLHHRSDQPHQSRRAFTQGRAAADACDQA